MCLTASRPMGASASSPKLLSSSVINLLSIDVGHSTLSISKPASSGFIAHAIKLREPATSGLPFLPVDSMVSKLTKVQPCVLIFAVVYRLLDAGQALRFSCDVVCCCARSPWSEALANVMPPMPGDSDESVCKTSLQSSFVDPGSGCCIPFALCWPRMGHYTCLRNAITSVLGTPS
jgi:hypothetical protein